jgi:Mrp family chromosome partitioning ATPase
MAEMLAELSADVDIILIDSPPVLSIADTTALVSWVDGVIFVVESGETRLQSAQQALSNLRQVGANIVGAVLNSVPPDRSPYNYYQSIETPESGEGEKDRFLRGKVLNSTLGWLNNRNGRSIFAWFQNKEFLPAIRSWFQSRR